MRVQCKNCLPKEGIEIPEFNQAEKNKILELTVESPIRSIKYIIEHYNLSHRDAKYITAHINKNYGYCNQCIFDKLDENILNALSAER